MNGEVNGDFDRPLFEEPTEDLERPDPWSGPKGFLLGGMGPPTKVELAGQYYRAAMILMESIRRNECEDYLLGGPVLYTYRHALELLLKGGMPGQGHHHDLRQLAGELSRYVREKHGRDIAPWIMNRLHEIADMDPTSTAFRYAEVRDPSTKKYVGFAPELHVGLDHLQRSMGQLFQALSRLLGVQVDGVHAELDNGA